MYVTTLQGMYWVIVAKEMDESQIIIVAKKLDDQLTWAIYLQVDVIEKIKEPKKVPAMTLWKMHQIPITSRKLLLQL